MNMARAVCNSKARRVSEGGEDGAKTTRREKEGGGAGGAWNLGSRVEIEGLGFRV